MDYTVIHDEKVQRFEIFESGQIAYLQYIITEPDGYMDLAHTVVPKQLEGQGLGSALVQTALDYARSEGLRVIPSCPFAEAYMEKHKEYQDLLVDGIRLPVE